MAFISGSDVFVTLLTGYGKSLIFSFLPWIFDGNKGKTTHRKGWETAMCIWHFVPVGYARLDHNLLKGQDVPLQETLKINKLKTQFNTKSISWEDFVHGIS